MTLAGALFALTGCASSVDPIERLGRKAAERMGPRETTERTGPREATAAAGAVAETCTGTTRDGTELALRLTEC